MISANVRDWTKAQGIEVKDQGQVPAEVTHSPVGIEDAGTTSLGGLSQRSVPVSAVAFGQDRSALA